MIKQQFLQHGMYYIGKGLDVDYARWNDHEKLFYYWKFKWGQIVPDTLIYGEYEKIGSDCFEPNCLSFNVEYIPLSITNY